MPTEMRLIITQKQSSSCEIFKS